MGKYDPFKVWEIKVDLKELNNVKKNVDEVKNPYCYAERKDRLLDVYKKGLLKFFLKFLILHCF